MTWRQWKHSWRFLVQRALTTNKHSWKMRVMLSGLRVCQPRFQWFVRVIGVTSDKGAEGSSHYVGASDVFNGSVGLVGKSDQWWSNNLDLPIFFILKLDLNPFLQIWVGSNYLIQCWLLYPIPVWVGSGTGMAAHFLFRVDQLLFLSSKQIFGLNANPSWLTIMHAWACKLQESPSIM